MGSGACQQADMKRRIQIVVGMLVTVVIGLASRKAARFLDISGLLYIGDALWAILVYQCILFVKPEIEEKRAAIICLIVSFSVEAGQLIHQKDLDQFRHTRVGHWVLGNGFDLFDLLAYTVGVTLFYLLRIRMKNLVAYVTARIQACC